MKDSFGAEREEDLLAALLGLPREELGQARTVGEGRARWLTEDPGRAYLKSGLPSDAQVLADAVYEMGGGALIAAEGCPSWVEIVAYAQPKRRRLIIHLDNQRPGEVGPDFALGVALPEGWEPNRLPILHGLGGEETELRPADDSGLRNAVRVPVPPEYAVVVIDCGEG